MMNSPGAMPIRTALDGSEPLANLTRRLQESRCRFEAIAPLLAQELRPHVQPGPVDETGWTLLADGSAVAAKLRQMLPSFSQAQAAARLAPLPIRVRILRS